MKTKRHLTALGLAAASALLLSACGTDDNSASRGDDAQGGNGGTSGECAGQENIQAEGASSQANAMDEFSVVYQDECAGFSIDYNPTGSGAGIKQFNAGQVDFAGSDSPLKDEEITAATDRCEGAVPLHLPMVFGPVAIAYNLPGVDDLVLDGETIAQIFNGTITSWNDDAIAALNEGVDLPDQEILPIFRSDESGTTENFQQYLEAAAGDAWTSGGGKSFTGGVGDGRAKSDGVASGVAGTEGSVTYVEVSFAHSNDLSIAQIDNGSGPVELNDESTGAAITNATLAGDGADMVIDLDSVYGTQAEGAYPLVMATYQIVCSEYPESETAEAVKSFLRVAATTGQENLSTLGYVPLPGEFQEQLLDSIETIS
ncbi:phosphate ABC transporter substrate-binding protein PstS [Actinoalloteichus spitiensis]|uniref:phosphate ABC transporter substrate-binding protein PstS n=1 Tax=Actinoalloteichus spitiensis TaxID=252394 RepID=UPI00037DF9FC|nr:phosphate ABC transporter substrate-binding protein PstS [Actinoalloteichus spitiensis]